MKKQLIVLFTLVAISLISFTSCEPFIENKITVLNQADGNVELVVAGKSYKILAHTNLVLSDFPKGTFTYETIYQIPLGISVAKAQGEVAGNMVLNAGTEILLKYISVIEDSSYTIFGILSSSDDVNRVDPFDDGTP